VLSLNNQVKFVILKKRTPFTLILANPPLPNILQNRGRAIRPGASTSTPQAVQNGQVTRYYLTPQNNAVVRMVAPTNTSATSTSTSTPQVFFVYFLIHLFLKPTSSTQYNSGNYSFTTSSTVTPSVTQQMPNNILDESFNNESDANLDEPTNTTTQSNASSKLVDPASISLDDVSEANEPSTPNASTAGGPPNDPEPGQASEKSVTEPLQPVAGDIPSDPEVANEAIGEANEAQEAQIAPLQPEETWHDVGIIKNATSHLVTHYFLDDNPVCSCHICLYNNFRMRPNGEKQHWSPELNINLE
jgi:hypothetical protein